MAVRKQIAMSLAEHAPDLAYNFFYDSLNSMTNAKLRKQAQQSDKYFECQLMQQIAKTRCRQRRRNTAKNRSSAASISSHIELLKKIYAKDADKGIEFGAAILSRLKSEHGRIKERIFLRQLAFVWRRATWRNRKRQAAKSRSISAMICGISPSCLRQDILDGDESTTWILATTIAEQIEKYAPGRAAQIRAKFTTPETASANSVEIVTVANMSTIARVRVSVARTSNASPDANALRRADEEREARETAEKNMMEDINGLGNKELPKEERDKVIAESRKIISQTPGKDKKIVALSLLAAQVAHAGERTSPTR